MTGVFGEPHEGEERRETVSAVIQRESDGKFLLLKFSGYNWIAPSVGGVEKGESVLKAAEREVFEETGYRTKAVRVLGEIVESHFYADHKKVWRYRIDQPVLLKLISSEPEEISVEEKSKHVVIWLTQKETLDLMTHKYNTIGICRYLGICEPEGKV